MAFSKKMLIEISQDIIEDAINNKDQTINDAASLLAELSIAVKRGKHIVDIPCLHKDIKIKNDLQGTISANDYNLLRSSRRNRQQFMSLCKILRTKVICSYSEPETDGNWDNIIHINPKEIAEFEFCEETHVLGENLNDVNFFVYLMKYYARLYKITNPHHCLLNRMGGGVTTNVVFKSECERKQHLCLVVTDSDYKIPITETERDIHLGNTAKNVLEIYNRYKPFNCYFYPMFKVAEIENLLPKNIIKKYKTDNKLNVVLEHDTDFYDIKKGLSYSKLWKDEVYNYWKNIYNIDVDFSDLDSKRDSCSNYEEFNHLHGKKNLLPGWGTDILDVILKNKEFSDLLYCVKKESLSSAQHEEWINIGKLMLEWTCSLPPRYS